MLTGEFRIAIDEKGRILIPSKLRAELDGDSLYVTRGIDNCLWLMLPGDFEKLAQTILDRPGANFDMSRRLLQRNIISPAQECDIDKAGRVNIPPTLRSFINVDMKTECTLSGAGSYLELWNTDTYAKYLNEMLPKFNEAAQSLSGRLEGES
jgi:MraZ protein